MTDYKKRTTCRFTSNRYIYEPQGEGFDFPLMCKTEKQDEGNNQLSHLF